MFEGSVLAADNEAVERIGAGISASGRLFSFWAQAFVSVRENPKRLPVRLRPICSHPITASYGFRGGREMLA
jgi:hypothetical protein